MDDENTLVAALFFLLFINTAFTRAVITLLMKIL